MKVAFVYDRVNKWGGAERVLLALQKLFPDAPLYTSVYHEQSAKWAGKFKVFPSFLQKFPFAMSSHEIYAPLMPIAFESFSFSGYDLVISITSEAAKGIITTPQTKHICYCLTPTRYLWSGYDEYFSNPFLRIISRPVISYLQLWDKQAANRPDAYIAISGEVQNRIKKYYNYVANVIYPPVSLSAKKKPGVREEIKDLETPYFLIVSRLVKYKRIDLAIKACNALKIRLKIIGSGKEERLLRRISGPTIEFLGNLTDEKLMGYYKNCQGFIFPGIEDFGITIVEAQSFGKPVLAFRAGGALETIIEGKTGLFFNEQSEESLIQKLEIFTQFRYNSNDCQKQANKFKEEIFLKNFSQEINRLMKI